MLARHTGEVHSKQSKLLNQVFACARVCVCVCVLGGGTEISHTLAALISPEGNRVFLGNFESAEE